MRTPKSPRASRPPRERARGSKTPAVSRTAPASGGSPRPELLDAAAEDALGRRSCLSPFEPNRFDPSYREARLAFDSVVSLLDLAAASAVPPPPSLKDRLMARISAEAPAVAVRETSAPPPEERPEGYFEVVPGVRGVSTSEAGWQDAPLPGLKYKVINRDTERGYTTRLLRLEAGAGYPKHRHGGTEEIFVLEGTVRVNGKLLRPGDYCRSEPGTWEDGTITETGAMAIVVSSDADEIELTTTS